MRPLHRFREVKPHIKVGAVTLVLIFSGVAVLLVSLAAIRAIDMPVSKANERVAPARADLIEVERNLGQTQNEFINMMTEPSHTQRVLDLEKVRKALSKNEEAWRQFKTESLELPGEKDLWARYEALNSELGRLEGPVGLMIINAEDTAPLWQDPNFSRLRQIQQESVAIVNQIDRDFYEPLERQQIEDASGLTDSAARRVLLAFAVVMMLSIPLAIVAYSSARRTEQKRRLELQRQAEQSRRSQLEAQLNRAFEMAGSEDAAYKIIGQALRENLPDGQPAELLISDSSVAHFRQVLSTDDAGHGPGCAVVAPSDCPASHRGDTLVFSHSQDLDACPYLRDRPGGACSAVCQPVSIAGKSIGVIHTTSPETEPPTGRTMVDLDLIARRAGERIGMLRAFAETESQARTDPLTGLLNRRSLENSTRRMVTDGQRYCVAYGDLDHFKKLNDTHGHDVGDRALRTFATALRDSIRPNDLACRYGGEEFVLVLPECEIDEAVAVVQRVRAGLADALLGGRLPPFTVSFGVATSAQAESFERVVGLADEALMRAKASGRDCVLVSGEGPPQLAAGPPAELGPGSF